MPSRSKFSKPSRSKLSHPAQAELSHFDKSGRAAMVDVSGKQPTHRIATASAFVELSPAVLAALPSNPKGDPLEVARFAGVLAANPGGFVRVLSAREKQLAESAA